MPLVNGQPNARERRSWIIEPDGTPHPGDYVCRFTKNGPDVPVSLQLRYPTDPDTGETLDRSPMWALRVGWTERLEKDAVNFPELSGEPTDLFTYNAIYKAGDWRDSINDAAEAAILTR